jgi:hypothetical protein
MRTSKLFLLFTVFAVSFVQQANAKIWRVNNNSNYNGTSLWGDNFGGTASYPVFKQLSDANASNLVSATKGDTIYVEGSTIDYSGVAITKKLVIIGPGYFLNENPLTSNDILEARLDNISFNTGAEGSKLMGIYVYGFYGITINVSNVLIKRCKIDKSITLANSISDISVLQNYFSNLDNNNTSAIIPNFYGFPTDFIFNNNICKKTLLLVSNNIVRSALECKNNVFDCPAITGNPSIRMNVSSFQNNILKTAAATVDINGGTNLNVSYNISASATGQFGTTNNNIVVTNITGLFVASGTSDGKYKLKANSKGSNNGSDGTDRGVFGGAASNRYTLSGLAPIPVIYAISTTGVTAPSTDLSVTISAKTIK